jgi:hypothetical protein
MVGICITLVSIMIVTRDAANYINPNFVATSCFALWYGLFWLAVYTTPHPRPLPLPATREWFNDWKVPFTHRLLSHSAKVRVRQFMAEQGHPALRRRDRENLYLDLQREFWLQANATEVVQDMKATLDTCTVMEGVAWTLVFFALDDGLCPWNSMNMTLDPEMSFIARHVLTRRPFGDQPLVAWQMALEFTMNHTELVYPSWKRYLQIAIEKNRTDAKPFGLIFMDWWVWNVSL